MVFDLMKIICIFLGATDCTLPWLAEQNPFIGEVKSFTINRCPPIIGDQDKEYCCYNSKGEVECCDLQQFMVFGFV